MKKLICSAAAMSLCIAAAASAEIELPKRKPGLWNLTITTSGMGKTTYDMKQCIDEATDAKMLQSGTSMATQMGMVCARNDMKKESDSKYSGVSECTFNGVKATSTSSFSGDFSKEYTGTVDAEYSPAMMGITKATTTFKARWAGACTAGQKPGDMVLPGGVTMNINDAAAMAPQGTKP